MKRIMIAGTNSGCGKTTVVCALLRAFVKRGMKTTSFKCGPDYIDPMFHSRIVGADAHNLDGFFCDGDMQNYLVEKYSSHADVSVIEGVMGYYDGTDHCASSHDTSLLTETPTVLVINARGMSMSVGAVMKGFLTFKEPSNIIGFIFNRLPDSQIETAKRLCDDMNVKYFGRLPNDSSFEIESRHLGLVTAAEISDLTEKTDRLAECAENNILIDDILEFAAKKLPSFKRPELPSLRANVRIAVASDEAFCFWYSENLDLLREKGCEVVTFSPLRDKSLPEGCHGLILCGGYPELYAERLFCNSPMPQSIADAIRSGMPCIAECGGFMYLHKGFTDERGKRFSGAGIIDAECYPTKKLQHFGYSTITAKKDNLLCKRGEKLPVHEFHYFDSTDCGSDFLASKPRKNLLWKCVHANENLYAGYPHIYFYADLKIADNFVKACERFKANETN